MHEKLAKCVADVAHTFAMPTVFDDEMKVLVAKLLLEAHVDAIQALTGESRLGHALQTLPPTALRSNLSYLAHYTTMGYMLVAHQAGKLDGDMKWDHPAPGTDVLEWILGARTFKFRRTNDEMQTPARSGHVKKSERHNANQGFLFEIPEDESTPIHWLICSGFDDGPQLRDLMGGRFFAWTAPFLSSVDRMVGERQTLFTGEAATLGLQRSEETGVSISKPLLTQKEKETAFEEITKRASNGQ